MISKNILHVFLSLRIDYDLENSADPDEILHFIWVYTGTKYIGGIIFFEFYVTMFVCLFVNFFFCHRFLSN